MGFLNGVSFQSRCLRIAALILAPGLLGAKGCGLATVGTECGGLAGVACNADEFCDFPPEAACGVTDQTGSCEIRPDACTLVYNPVCGCDDRTYSNACTAHAAGISVAGSGECGAASSDVCGGITGAACAADKFCHYSLDAQCGAADQTGTCDVKPDACTEEYAPVCGCDDNTYSNACFANAAGVSVAAQGECESDGGGTPDSCGGQAGTKCGADEYCDFSAAGECGTEGEAGECVARPEGCDDVYSPVCGCDGKTYSNDCEAHVAGTSAATTGECEPTSGSGNACGGLTGAACEQGEFCNFDIEAHCGASDQTGVCEVTPSVCGKNYAPVCGCDDQTYSNPCEANAAGISVAGEGACEAPSTGTCGGDTPATCAADEFCSYAPDAECGFTDAPGRCEPKPELCGEIYAPVCGCDGNTYDNECVANAAGVSVATSGECAPSGSTCGGLLGSQCGDGEFCYFAIDAQCGAADQTGTCEKLPEVCGEIYAPVCGCDDNTYENECSAHAAGVSAVAEGECGDPANGGVECGARAGDTCAEGEYCYYTPEAICGDADASGTCRAIPDGACTAQYDPVCGCDGNTYGNACEASLVGMPVAATGECEP